jgi:tetratricopeptide (TPR) repeat protein
MTDGGDELDDELHEQIQGLSEQGNEALEAKDYERAVRAFTAAYALVPEPKAVWDAALWLQASLGDTYFEQEQYERALEHFVEARGASTGAGNPFVALRLGQCHLELGHLDEARRFLFQAYLQEGTEIFEDQDPKYLDAIRSEIARSPPGASG